MNDVTKTAKNLAQQVAKQVVQEPLEILNQARDQAIGAEIDRPSDSSVDQAVGKSGVTEEQKAKIEAQGKRQLQALEAEMKDIAKHDLFSDIQARIAQGEDVPLTNFPELSYEQREVLKAQTEAVKETKAMGNKERGPLVQPSSKQGRRMVGMPGHVQKQQTHVERVQPPSG